MIPTLPVDNFVGNSRKLAPRPEFMRLPTDCLIFQQKVFVLKINDLAQKPDAETCSKTERFIAGLLFVNGA
jgi:hypothetical protein